MKIDCRKVLEVKVHEAITFSKIPNMATGANMTTNIFTKEKLKGSELEVTPAGVYIKTSFQELIVPWSNIIYVTLEPEKNVK